MISAQIKSSDVPDQWTADVRTIIQREGRAVRGGPACTVEIKSLHENIWGKLMLPGSGFEFVNNAERDIVLRKLEGRK